MVIYLYRWKIKPGAEADFCEAWAIVTKAFLAKCGSLGSRLHQSDNGAWIGYAQWPSSEARAACAFTSPELEAAKARMKAAIEVAYPEERLTVREDFLA